VAREPCLPSSQDKIRALTSQVLIGGRKLEDTPQFINALEEQ